ncbi:aminotransferase class I/II-fold pyridoxal phosphate-dependent enzyme [Salegentibacter chungangensis]|uniref:Aminotransferase class I/II-fold pyridoxal phosphate-dependent enzyme n=1 Tax=Salegentibacter chungangensis TaxID=1335724 RepID=A0ABW3NQ18_9FLAO
MQSFPLKLEKSLQNRKQENSFRELPIEATLVDFSSNDYLGFAKNAEIFRRALQILKEYNLEINGSTGSRLLSGNHSLFSRAEKLIAETHNADTALIFNSGYDANIGFFSALPQRGDLVFYDELVHASIRQGISGGKAKAYKFTHNDLRDLGEKIERTKKNHPNAEVYVVTESVFSMDGDILDLRSFARFCGEYGSYLVIDEAHATGVFGNIGEGLVGKLELEDKVFARIHTFGKAMGCHGAAILGSKQLRDYLVNFSRSFIYTTALPPHAVATQIAAYEYLKTAAEIEVLEKNIRFFRRELEDKRLKDIFIESRSAIHSCVIPGNEKVKQVAELLRKSNFDVKAILSPTVPKGRERLRFCIHAYNSEAEISEVLELLGNFVAQ